MKYVYAVITKVDVEEEGNLYDEVICYDRHLKAWREVRDGDKTNKPWKRAKFPVFTLGEIVILRDDEWGREVDGLQRAPHKWYVEYECFTSMKKAIELAEKILKEKYE